LTKIPNVKYEMAKAACSNCERLEAQLKEQGTKLKEQDKLIKQLERRLARYENTHTPPSCLKESVKPDSNPKKL
jgi:hypothetical protein